MVVQEENRPITEDTHHDLVGSALISCVHCGGTQSLAVTRKDSLMFYSKAHGTECDSCREQRQAVPIEKCACCGDTEGYLEFSSFAPKRMGKVCEGCNEYYSDAHFERGDF